MIRRTFEALARPLLRAPSVVVDLEVDDGMRGRLVSLPAQDILYMGTEDGGHATANGVPVMIIEGDEPTCSAEVADKAGTSGVVLRRRVLYVFFREIWSLSWTLVGMVTVLITLSGDAQKIAAVAVLVGLVLHSMTLRVSRMPRK